MNKKIITPHNIVFFVLLFLCFYRFSLILNSTEDNSTSTSKAIVSSTDTLMKGFKNYVLAPAWVDAIPHSYWNITNHLDSYQELNFNAAHMWPSDSDSLGYWGQDTLRQDQILRLNNIIQTASQKGMTSILERIRLTNLCYSQRLVYEAEGGNNGFSYQRRTANVIQDNGRTVIHACTNEIECPESDATPRMLCDSIYENLQHTDLYYFWPGHTDLLDWKVKPVMRIDTADFNGNDSTPVVAVIVKGYLGSTIDSVLIQVKNFGDQNGFYDGSYLENYAFSPNPNLLTVPGDTIPGGLNYGRPGPGAGVDDCKVDFKVYWFGQVDVWFDKMIVDDVRADQLFNKDTTQNFDKIIKDEAMNLGSKMIFFADEIVTSQAYSTKYVIDKLKYYNPDCRLEFAQADIQLTSMEAIFPAGFIFISWKRLVSLQQRR